MPPTKARKGSMINKQQKRSTFKRLIKSLVKSNPLLFSIVVLCIIVFSISHVLGSYFVGNILIDKFLNPSVFAPDGHTRSVEEMKGIFDSINFLSLNFTQLIILLSAIFVVGIIAGYFYNFLMAFIAQKFQYNLRNQLFNHMENLPISYFDKTQHGDIMSIYTNDVDSLREMLARSLPMCIQAIFTMLACLVMMLMTDFYLMIVVFSMAILMFFLSRFFTTHSGKYFVEQQQELAATDGYIEEMIQGQKVIKVFNHEDENVEGFKNHNDHLYEVSSKANKYANSLMPIVNQLGNVQYALIALIGGIFVILNVKGFNLIDVFSLEGHVFSISTTGLIASFLLYSKQFVNPIGQVSSNLNSITQALAGAFRIYSLIDLDGESDEGYVTLVNAKEDENGDPIETVEVTNKWAWKHPHNDGTTSYTWLKGKINLYNVDFGYSHDKIVLHDITIYAEPGQKVAFVGPTGAGKTTITNLLNRFYDIADGKIRYDDININKIKKEDLRSSLGMVFQETKLFTGTIKENIRYGKLDATDQEITNAAKLTHADEFISQLPNGYDTMLTNAGMSLSQGQRQLISIARTAIANPPVLILDEATSSIDSRTEALVQKGMDALMNGRTVFVIAHRLSTIKNSDVIMVLDQGKIIERGTHDTLLAQKGKYYQLYTGNKI